MWNSPQPTQSTLPHTPPPSLTPPPSFTLRTPPWRLSNHHHYQVIKCLLATLSKIGMAHQGGTLMTNKTVPYRHDRGSGHGRGGYGAGRGGTGTGRGGHGPAHNNLDREHTHQRYVPVGAPQARRSDIELSQHSPQGATDHQQGLSSDVESGKAKKPHPPFCWKCKCTRQ